jgi:hypothetical protein
LTTLLLSLEFILQNKHNNDESALFGKTANIPNLQEFSRRANYFLKRGGPHWAKKVNFLQKYKSFMFHYVVHSLQPLAYLYKTDPSGTPCKQISVNTLKVRPICYIINF